MDSKQFLSYASSYTPEEWYRKLELSVKYNEIDGIKFPSFPDPDLQQRFVGSSNEKALIDGALFYNIIYSFLNDQKSHLTSTSKVMDFGCGWGRVARFFYRDILQENLYLVDPWQMVIDVCKETGVYGQLLKTDLLPPLIFGSNQFDLIYAFSVFSHLSENAANLWIEELQRVLKPKGYLIVTIQGRSFIDFCDKLRNGTPGNAWEKNLTTLFTNTNEVYDTYDNGSFLYVPSGGGPELPSDVYGDAIVSKGYILKNWTKNLRFIDFVDDRKKLPQAYVVLQKP